MSNDEWFCPRLDGFGMSTLNPVSHDVREYKFLEAILPSTVCLGLAEVISPCMGLAVRARTRSFERSEEYEKPRLNLHCVYLYE